MPDDALTLADLPLESPLLASPVLDLDIEEALVSEAVIAATDLGKIAIGEALERAATTVAGIHSLAEFQSPFKAQNDRGTCWAFAGAAALEAAYRRRFGTEIDVSEEYIFHMGKSFALNRDAQGNVVQPVENNSSLTGFQGAGDIVRKLTENAAPPEGIAPYLPSQQSLLDILPVLGFANQQALVSQEDFDTIEFCEQHIPLLSRVNARYRAAEWASLGSSPSIEALEGTLLANHEVVCDVTNLPAGGGHVLMLIGFDRNRRVFFAKNHWGENDFIEILYENDPTWVINSGWFIQDVVDPTFVQNEACWLGNWWVTIDTNMFRVLLRRSEDFLSPGTPTRLGSAYLSDGRHDVNGVYLDGGSHVRLFIAENTAPTAPGTLSGTQIDATLNFTDVYNASGSLAAGQPVSLSRFTTRFAGLFEKSDGTAFQARHGIDSDTYQAAFNDFVSQGFRLTSVCGYSEGREARFNAIWQQREGPPFHARHNLTSAEYQAEFDQLAAQGFRLINVSGYAIDGEARYAAIWEQHPGPDLQARHGLNRVQYQETFDELIGQGFVLRQVNGYRVNVDVLFAAIWEREEGVGFQARHGLTSSVYQKTFDELVAAGHRLSWVSGYSDTGIARYAAIWRLEPFGEWQAFHGLDAVGYQARFDELTAAGFRPVQVSGYGDGFYPA